MRIVYADTPVELKGLSHLLGGGETFTVEYKTDPFNDAELVETVAC